MNTTPGYDSETRVMVGHDGYARKVVTTGAGTMTSYATWAKMGTGYLTVAESVTAALTTYADEYDVIGLVDDYRDAINDALPEGVHLHGDEFYGPWPYPMGMCEKIGMIVRGVDKARFWALAVGRAL